MSGQISRVPLQVSTTLRSGGEATMAVSGTVERESVARLDTLVTALCAAGATRVVVDLSRVSACDRSLLAVLERTRSQVEAMGGWLVLDGSPATMSAYDELPLDAVFRIYRDACGYRGGAPLAAGAR
ncbi:STAS domain-containing protein [Pseudonocardia sp.]|uniref:STAS domain-containing protein n=1 Tax=Pseudonocardia sp. TaxID=60912 RepID=UPI00262DE790|nr:STAS domain-containing protein [Pseudonocardia sp.]